MLSKLSLVELDGGIHFIDIGSSGELNRYWTALISYLHLYAFDPNIRECERLNKLSNRFASAIYLPYAIAGNSGEFTLYETDDPFCWSLLEPDSERLERFSFGHKFNVSATSNLNAKTLSQVNELHKTDIDIIKSDTQGLELPILSSAKSFVDSAIVIEVETGFYSNYKNETTFHEISRFLQDRNFRLFDINSNHRIARRNKFSNVTRSQEIMWCESIWIKDYIDFFKHHPFNLSRSKALKVLLLCANHGCIDYGLELAYFFYEKGLLTQEELKQLHSRQAWQLSQQRNFMNQSKIFLQKILRLLPNRVLKNIADVLLEVTHTDHPLKNKSIR